MSAHFEDYIVQPARFNVAQGIGCSYVTVASVLTFLIIPGATRLIFPLFSILFYYRESAKEHLNADADLYSPSESGLYLLPT